MIVTACKDRTFLVIVNDEKTGQELTSKVLTADQFGRVQDFIPVDEPTDQQMADAVLAASQRYLRDR